MDNDGGDSAQHKEDNGFKYRVVELEYHLLGKSWSSRVRESFVFFWAYLSQVETD